MRLLLFSDLHGDHAAARRLVEAAREVDVVVGAGDYAVMRQGLPQIVRTLSAIERPAVLVCGNAESPDDLRAAVSSWPAARVLHGEQTVLQDVVFFGLGGAVPVTPFGSWSVDLTEEEAGRLLDPCPPQAVLVVHSPPKCTVDLSADGKHLGSEMIRKVVEEKMPRLVVCGHIHAAWQQTAWIGRTPVVNAGPRGVLWEL